MGAWIEILKLNKNQFAFVSLPTWGRGLKSECGKRNSQHQGVAPYMGAWIEI